MKLNPEKYNRNIPCYVLCAEIQRWNTRKSLKSLDVGCRKEFTNDELIQENRVSIDAHVDEIKKS